MDVLVLLVVGFWQQQGTSSTNVWARPLSGGEFALVFLNAGPNATDVTCDAACFSAINVTAGQT